MDGKIEPGLSCRGVNLKQLTFEEIQFSHTTIYFTGGALVIVLACMFVLVSKVKLPDFSGITSITVNLAKGENKGKKEH